jgi:hypothetical protein
MLVISYRQLVENGVTSWDSKGELIVLHRPVHGLQYSLYIIGSTLIAFVFAATTAMNVTQQ